MPPTESQILSTFLLPLANIRALLSLRSFTALFPQPLRKNPQIPYLYHELQHQRGLIIDQIEKNIAAEVKAGEKQRREVIKARRRDEREEMGILGEDDRDELDMEVELFGQTSHLPPHRSHTLSSIIPEMETAATDLEEELKALEREASNALVRINAVIGDLSDLRYGRFDNPTGGEDVAETVLEGLRNLEEVCEGVLSDGNQHVAAQEPHY
ncbi:MAG: hypothetical protein M1839_001068 [Geoglossum umbratile]|nr:MAG: hypothetical protein M1839_001068 [Geoglossum umbratile]